MGMSARAYNRVLRIARTVADLDDRDNVTTLDIAEAINYRKLAALRDQNLAPRCFRIGF